MNGSAAYLGKGLRSPMMRLRRTYHTSILEVESLHEMLRLCICGGNEIVSCHSSPITDFVDASACRRGGAGLLGTRHPDGVVAEAEFNGQRARFRHQLTV